MSRDENLDTKVSLKRHLLSFEMALILLVLRPDSEKEGLEDLMKTLLLALILAFATAPSAFAKLSDRQAMKCIDTDALAKSAFQDLQAAYEMRMVSAKDFFNVMDKASNCPQLKKDIKKLQASAMAQFPAPPKGGVGRFRGSTAGGNTGANPLPPSSSPSTSFGEPPHFEDRAHNGLNESWDSSAYPPPPPLPDSDFDEDFGEF